MGCGAQVLVCGVEGMGSMVQGVGFAPDVGVSAVLDVLELHALEELRRHRQRHPDRPCRGDVNQIMVVAN